MNAYRHHVSGFFAEYRGAENTLSRLVELRLPRGRLQIFNVDSSQGTATSPADDNGMLTHVLVSPTMAIGVRAGLTTYRRGTPGVRRSLSIAPAR